MKNNAYNAYDELPYTQYVHHQTQPHHLATVATLFGLHPPALKQCRVLELGCASGMNTLAMALAIPQGTFIGIDASAQQIKQGQQYLQQLGVTNLTLHALDILDVNPNFGYFDYIIAHGVYSWVAPPVRDKILQICRQHLHPHGIAYVSYNVYPGWHLNKMLREMMLYHTRRFHSVREKLDRSKMLLKFFTQTVKDKFDAYSLSLKKELELLNHLDDHYLSHEYLEEYNEPVFFHEFIHHAQSHGLQYLADSQLTFLAVGNFFVQEVEKLDIDLIEKEQYMDFLRNHPFRETLLCHQEVEIRRNLDAEQVKKFRIAAPLKPASPEWVNMPLEPQMIHNDGLERFNNAAGEAVLSIASPLLKMVCLCLGEGWPASLAFDELMDKIKHLLLCIDQETTDQVMSSENIQEVKELLLEFYLKNLVEFHLEPPPFTLEISDKPVASPLARLQSQQGEQVTNLRYEIFSLNFITREILKHLDGTHDSNALIAILQSHLQTGRLQWSKGEEQLALTEIDEPTLYDNLSKHVHDILKNLALKAYLIA